MPEQLFVNAQNPGEAISTVKTLQKANAQGQRIYYITQANQAAILPNIHHDPDTMAEIQNALNAGQEVITHTDAVSVSGWSGAGYIIWDPETGAGQYLIDGGLAGGRSDPCPTPSLMPVHNEITIVEAIILAFVVVGLVGLALPAAAAGITVLIELLLVAFGIVCLLALIPTRNI